MISLSLSIGKLLEVMMHRLLQTTALALAWIVHLEISGTNMLLALIVRG